MKSSLPIWPLLLLTALLTMCRGQRETTSTETDKEKKKETVKSPELNEEERMKARGKFLNANKEKLIGNNDKAIELFQATININPTNDAAYYELARLYKDKGKRRKALDHAKKAVERSPENIWYRTLLADLYLKYGKYEKAVSQYQRILDQRPKKHKFYFDLADALDKGKRYSKAIEVYDRIEDKMGRSRELYLQKQKLYSRLGKTGKAIEEIRELIEFQPHKAENHGVLAELYLDQGKKDKAIETFGKVLELDPENGIAHLSLFQIYKKEKKEEKAFNALKKAFRSKKVGIDTKMNVMLKLYSKSETQKSVKEEAYELLEILVETHPEKAKSHTVYGDFLMRDGRLKEARKHFKKAVELDANRFTIWHQIFIIDSRLQNYEDMLSATEKAMELFPAQPLVYLFDGIAHMQLSDHERAKESLLNGRDLVMNDQKLKGRFDQRLGEVFNELEAFKRSDKAFERAIEADPQNAFLLNNYSYYLSKRKDSLQKARNMAKKANKLEPGRTSFMDTYGWVLYQMDRYEKAKRWLKKALDNGGDNDAVILEHYGDVLFKLGNKKTAHQYWKKAKKAGGDSELLEKKISDKELYE